MSSAVALVISILSLLVSVIAIGVSVWTHNRSHKLQKRIVFLEEEREKDRQVEKEKAYLTAKIEKEELPHYGTSPIKWRYFLVIENKGLSEARNIELLLKDQAVVGNRLLQNVQKEVNQIGPHSYIRYEFSNGFMRELPLPTRITWYDDSGESGKYQTTLTL
jgi:hypothetical protein